METETVIEVTDLIVFKAPEGMTREEFLVWMDDVEAKFKQQLEESE